MSESENGSVHESMILEGGEQEGEENALEKCVTLVEDEPSEKGVTEVQKTSGTTIKSLESEKIRKEKKKRRKTQDLSDDPEQRRIAIFFRNKGISENLIGRILKNGLSDGFDRLLRALGITDKEIAKFEWKKRFDTIDRVYDSFEPEPIDAEDACTSPDNLYLKKYFGHILPRAMKDLVKLKPHDPVGFLGNWLINYKVSEEREIRRLEFEADLLVQRQLSKASELSPDSKITDYDDKEESFENDWSYGE